jgi:hypothetical protein
MWVEDEGDMKAMFLCLSKKRESKDIIPMNTMYCVIVSCILATTSYDTIQLLDL